MARRPDIDRPFPETLRPILRVFVDHALTERDWTQDDVIAYCVREHGLTVADAQLLLMQAASSDHFQLTLTSGKPIKFTYLRLRSKRGVIPRQIRAVWSALSDLGFRSVEGLASILQYHAIYVAESIDALTLLDMVDSKTVPPGVSMFGAIGGATPT